ncbi:hypothetical protein DICPUDRAFT_86501 [Dictyostelium purpureum]|uniref:Glycoside hydrolase family 5 domain-containing protein n=1 Tax=Dictyostelium purpureum TaxID=5786 RepID=F0ZC12_DICPU|nr:uncharacterized protein DICPUDRAFT_86501 [Dictyostelium purpureum]EGC38513.1 hypothetical protein DICPUDRAFT_86501 [Dictyostelium purpureum]|eukprot:XP_003284978.1 hypothetical protein DICPUDRAFT_86501 [Dictyostelium purpureum]
MKNKHLLNFLILNILIVFVVAQKSGTYNGPQYTNGINAGYKEGWSNSDLGPLMGEAGIRSQRMKFPCTFFQKYGYKILYDNNSFGSAKLAGQSNFTAFITYDHGNDSFVPAKIYEPIWDDNNNVNKGNEFAYCVYQIVTTYKADVKIYEIFNEPDWVSDWKVVSTWATSPPLDLPRFGGNIYSYIRLLRIAWEVAKSVDPTCFIAVGGLGYPNFLDAILRYSDTAGNLDPLSLGINYIDAVSTHFYPMYGTSKTNSDAYLTAYIELQNSFKQVAKRHSLNAIWIVTETGVATKSGDGYYGSEELARNYFLKLPSISTTLGVRQNHIFILGDTNSGSNAFANMGLFYDYQNVDKDKAIIKPSSKGLKTWDLHLSNRTLDPSSTESIQSKMPSGVVAYAYNDGLSLCYLIWANSSSFETDEDTTSIQISLEGSYISVYNYLNDIDKFTSDNGKTVSISVDSTPQFIYIDIEGPGSGPSSASNITYSFYLLIILIFFAISL